MEIKIDTGIRSMDEFDYTFKTVILRVDINSPIDPVTKKIVNDNRIRKSIPTIKYLLDHKAKVAMIAHQGDSLDYHNLIPLREHAERLSRMLDVEVRYIDDVCGHAAKKAIADLRPEEAVLLGNLRYLTEEISTFEDAVKLKPEDMLHTYLIRSLAPLADYYVNDAFAAAHRNAPSMVAFQEVLPSAAGILLMDEITALTKVMEKPEHPSVVVLGGLKISDAFGMMKQVLQNGTADQILACGVTGEIMLQAQGIALGGVKEKFIKERSLDVFIQPAREYLHDYPGKIVCPVDLAYARDSQRLEVSVCDLPMEEMFMDIGTRTIGLFKEAIAEAGTIFVNGPAGVYENELFSQGTREIMGAIAATAGYSVIGGGDTVSAATRLTDITKYDYVCTAGGAMVRFLSGKQLPLIEAMKKSYQKPLTRPLLSRCS